MKVYLFPEKFDEHCTSRILFIPELLQTAAENSKGQKQDMTPNHYLFMFLLKVLN